MNKNTRGKNSEGAIGRGIKPVAYRRGLAAAIAIFLLLAPFLAHAAEKAPPKPGPQDKCPVCGMFVAPFPNWLSIVIFKDGSHAFFDGPKDMFKYVFDPKRYDRSKQATDIEAVFVTDYYKVTRIDGKRAWYVTGSDVGGPMGDELIPFEKESDAKAFLIDHGGKKVFTFKEVTPEIVGIQESRKGHGSHNQDGHKGQ